MMEKHFGDWIKSKSPTHELYIMIYEDVVDEFNELKSKYGYVNFDDLLTTMLQILKEKSLSLKRF